MKPTNNTTDSIGIYDLDGTLISFNSFQYWLVFSFIAALFFFRIDYNWLIFKTTLQRVFGKIDRFTFKEKMMNFHEQNKDKKFIKCCNASFASFLKRKTKKSLLNKHEKSLLATAAPDCYVKYYVTKMNCFENYSASYIAKGILQENIGERKLQSTMQLIGNKPHNIVLYTDHFDDVPLAQKACEVFLVCPADKTKQEYESLKIRYTLVK
ncbi:MAG: haloacid dehalogenase-like hydrolase [Prevotellaceae bacterium]|jgi:phosphoserine phosphatase|nr:haloacid dehalogenase-like hydrolase [Prevotellaceae bacterium]